MSSATDELLELGGWRIGIGFASSVGLAVSRHFYAVYGGDAFDHAERGIAAIMARAHPGDREHPGGAQEAAQLVVHSFAEGYFGAPRTLGPKRAASLALGSINNWLFSQLRTDMHRHFGPVSLTALLFHGGHMGVVHIGFCRLYRQRAGKILPLLGEQLRPLADPEASPTRAIGLDPELWIDYSEEPVAAGDRYLLVSGAELEHGDALTAAFALDAAALKGNTALMRLDIAAAPVPDAATPDAALASLPLRPAPREGDNWDGFIIGKTIYHGRYTVLKTAYDTLENREVALKIPLPSMLQDQVFSAGFMREAWIGSTVRGNNIARYIELPPERRASLYLVLPFYKGETLEARLRRGPPFSVPDGIGIALKLCEAVQDLAAIQIIHRDIKPDNIMLLPGNELKLLDLGLAYLPGIDMQEAARPGGTLRYMAPELLQGVQANPRTEVFALGITLYRMFAGGAYPFGQREAVPLSRLRPDLPSWLGRILQRALAPEPAERYADAAELAVALQAALTSGVGDAPKAARFLNRVQVWQALTLIFGAGFFLLLLRALQ